MTAPFLHAATPRAAQRGAILLLALITLVVLLIGAVALVRSFDTAFLTAGSMSFKRDLVNEGELVIPRVLAAFSNAAALGTVDQRSADQPLQNYSATLLDSDDQGIPAQLSGNVKAGGKTVALNAAPLTGTTGVTVTYVIDRMCDGPGVETSLGPAHCVTVPVPFSNSGTTNFNGSRAELNAATGERGALPQQTGFRVSMRVDGPRNTRAFLQTTFAQ
jgi:hypothetical protein